MAHFRFASIEHAETHGYAYDTDGWTSQAQVDTNFRMYQTYGDGLIQHSGDWPVTVEFLADYLNSLAQAMLTDVELAERMMYSLMRGPTDVEIAFAASVVFKPMDENRPWEKKTRYFSVSEKKITTSESKQYDKRYAKVERAQDGTAEAIYQMLIPEYASGLQRFQYAEAIRKWTHAGEDRPYMELTGKFLKWTEDRDKARDMMHGLEIAQHAAESHRLRCAVESSLESIKRNMERRKEQAKAESGEAESEAVA
jgi:hypothetical protein